MSWTDDANCRGVDTNLFFAEKGSGKTDPYGPLRALCAACPVRQECLDEAIARSERYGFWGGMTPKERFAYARTHMKWQRCQHCGVRFETPTRSNKYCSDECREAGMRAVARRYYARNHSAVHDGWIPTGVKLGDQQ